MQYKYLKDTISIKKRGNLNYIINSNRKVIKYKPWLGDMFSFLYDRIMSKSIFPEKFNASIAKHSSILSEIYYNIHNSDVLEIATGSGNIAGLLPSDNNYFGTDISEGLLRIAARRFRDNGFKNSYFYVSGADTLPFLNSAFDICICNLSLNFFDDINAFLSELRRVIKKGGTFYCSIPLPNKKPEKAKIRGTLYNIEEYRLIFLKYDFQFKALPHSNGALLYFTASRL